jgi:hypothetical protein
MLISEVTNISEWRIFGVKEQREWRKFHDTVRRHGIAVRGLDGDTDSDL